MSGLDNMKTRISYAGGDKQQDRMIEDKLRSLKRAMFNSYQGATAVLEDGREFRCLINPDKMKTEYRDKIISIPFEDVCLNKPKVGKTTEGIEPIGMKVGDTFLWKEDNTYWLVYLRYEEERAYFRAEIRNCDYEIEINGRKYRGYLRGPDDEETIWKTKHNISWTDVDYMCLLYIVSNEETRAFFHRFQKVDIYGKPYEVQIVDPISNQNLLMVALKETFSNEMEAATQKEIIKDKGEVTSVPKDPVTEPKEYTSEEPHIVGPETVFPYDRKKYTIANAEGGTWEIDNTKKAVITHQSQKAVTIDFVTGRSGEISLIYKRDGADDIVYKVTIASL